MHKTKILIKFLLQLKIVLYLLSSSNIKCKSNESTSQLNYACPTVTTCPSSNEDTGAAVGYPGPLQRMPGSSQCQGLQGWRSSPGQGQKAPHGTQRLQGWPLGCLPTFLQHGHARSPAASRTQGQYRAIRILTSLFTPAAMYTHRKPTAVPCSTSTSTSYHSLLESPSISH